MTTLPPLPEPFGEIPYQRPSGMWGRLEGYTAAQMTAYGQDCIAKYEARIAELEKENENLRTVMMAAAVELAEHWGAHCDAEGYGPANLLCRLENGYPEQYGYNAVTVINLEKRVQKLEAAAKLALDALNALELNGGTQAWVKAYPRKVIDSLQKAGIK